jgi:hypothetical protein
MSQFGIVDMPSVYTLGEEISCLFNITSDIIISHWDGEALIVIHFIPHNLWDPRSICFLRDVFLGGDFMASCVVEFGR